METKKLSLFLIIFFLNNITYAQVSIDTSPYKIALSFDGNAHDADDLIATPLALAMIAEAGLKDRLVHVDYSNHIWHDHGNSNDVIGDQVLGMRNAVNGAVSKWNYTNDVFYEVRISSELNAAKQNFKAKVAAAHNAGERLYYVLGGPMEVSYQCVEQVPNNQRSSITAVSHSTWNETHQHGSSRTWDQLKNTGIKTVQIADQNTYDCHMCGDDDDMSTKQFSKWKWLESMGSKYKWLYNQNPFPDKFDPSDAGMTWWVITGRPGIGSESNPKNLWNNTNNSLYASPAKVEELFKKGSAGGASSDKGGSVTLPGKIEAEDFDNQSGIKVQATADSGGGKNVGQINNGDWMEYNVNVSGSNLYNVRFRVASASSGGKIEIRKGNIVLGSVNVPATGGWQKWKTVSTNIKLLGGQQILRLKFVGGSGGLFNINWMEFTLAPEPSPSQPPSSSKYFFIVNKNSGKKIRPESGSEDARIIQAPANWSQDTVQWEQIPTENGYFYLKNKATGKYFRPNVNEDFAGIVQKPTSYDEHWTQWRKVNTGDGYFHLENRATGKRIRSRSKDDVTSGNDYSIELAPIDWTGDWVRWKFVEVGSGARLLSKTNTPTKKANPLIEVEESLAEAYEINIYPNPTSTYLNVAGVAKAAQLQVFDMMGKELINITGQNNINVSVLPAGMYLLTIDGKYKQRFLKK